MMNPKNIMTISLIAAMSLFAVSIAITDYTSSAFATNQVGSPQSQGAVQTNGNGLVGANVAVNAQLQNTGICVNALSTFSPC